MSAPFEPPDLRQLRRRLREIDARQRATYGPLEQLGTAVVVAAFNAQRSLAEMFGFSNEGKASEPQVLMFYEFLYFFMHLMLRVVARGFTQPQVRRFLVRYSPRRLSIPSFFIGPNISKPR
jgi:hypothetical protein